MSCPVTVGFFYDLEHGGEGKVVLYQLSGDALGTFPELRAAAIYEPDQSELTYRLRAQYAMSVAVSVMARKAPNIVNSLVSAESPVRGLELAEKILEEIEDRVLVSKMKRNAGGDNMHRLSDYLIVREGLKGYHAQARSYMRGDFRSVGGHLGNVFRSMGLPVDFSLKTGRKLLSIKEATHGG